MSDLVTFDKQGGVGVITVNNPPVNALSQGVRQGLMDAIARGVADSAVSAMVIIGAGRTFIAGADIREFGKPPLPPDLNSVLVAIEGSSKPVVAAIHGTALGGGLEVCLACHYRVAVAAGQVGLPEVKLGLLPGAGGTQRLPRVAGVEAALKMIVSGDPVRAPRARSWASWTTWSVTIFARARWPSRSWLSRRSGRSGRSRPWTTSWRRPAPIPRSSTRSGRASSGRRADTWRPSSASRRCRPP